MAEGLVDRIYHRETTKEEQQAWMDNEEQNCFDEYTWQQEYCCVAVDEATAFLPYDLISTCELDDILRSLSEVSNDLYVGVDIGRRKDLTVIWVLLGNIKGRFLLSYDDSPKIRELYKGFEMIEVERLNGINNRSDVENRKKIFKELLIANYPIKELHERLHRD